jgi:hypothetical protein
VANLTDRCQVEPLGIDPSGLVFLDRPAESGEHFGFKPVQVIAADCFPGRNDNRVAAAHLKHSIADGGMVLGPAPVAPSHHRNCKHGQEIGMAGQNAESAGLVFSPQISNIIRVDDNR